MAYTKHGDLWLDLSDFEKFGDFMGCVKITDLDSAIGFEGAYLIERGSIYIPEDPAKRKAALECCGWENEKEITPIMLAEAFDAYWGVERQSWAGEISIQTIKGGNMSFEGWTVDQDETIRFQQSGLSIEDFIEANYL